MPESSKKRDKVFPGILFSNEARFASVFFVLLLLGVFLSGFWHTLAPYNISEVSMHLKEYDYIVFDDSNMCLSVVVDPSYFKSGFWFPLSVVSGGKALASANFIVSGEVMEKELCIPSSELESKNNLVEVFSGSRRLFFHVEKRSGKKPASDSSLSILDSNSGFVRFELNSSFLSSYRPIEISVNGEIDHFVYPSAAKQVFSEKIETKAGENKVKVSYGSVSAETVVAKEDSFAVPFALGALLFCAALAVLLLFVFSSEESFFGKAAFSLASLAGILVAITFVLNFLGLLSLQSFLSSFVLVFLLLALAFRKNFKPSFTNLNLSAQNPLVIFIIILAILTPLVFHLFSWSHATYWNVFYERHSEKMAETFTQPLFDDSSYFGRVLGFIPGYFFLESSLSWLLGLSGSTGLFAAILLFANAIFFFAVFYFCESLGFSLPKRALFFILLWFESFMRDGILVSPRHAISIAILLIAIAMLMRKKNSLLSGAILGVGGFIQTPLLAAFPPLYFVVSKEFDWKALLRTTIVALLVFGLLYAPNFFAFGVMSQAESKNWGYLIDYSVVYFLADFGTLILFFLAFHLIPIARKEVVIDGYAKKLALAAVIGFLFMLFVSYRWNVYYTVNLVVLLVYLLPERFVSGKDCARLLSVVFLISLVLINVVMGPYALASYQKSPLVFLKRNVSSDSRILADPIFGHAIEYLSGRKVMADLAVEYANQEMLSDAYRFLGEKDYALAKKYGINYVVSQTDVINRNAFENERLEVPLEFESLDKIYDNGFIFVHRVPGS